MKYLVTLAGLVLIAASVNAADTIPVQLSAPDDVGKIVLNWKKTQANEAAGEELYATWQAWALAVHVPAVDAYHVRKMNEYKRDADQFQAAQEAKKADLATLRELAPHLTAAEITQLKELAEQLAAD